MHQAMVNRDDSKKTDFIERRQPREKMGFIPGTLDEKTRSVEVVAATEAPSEVYDPNRWEVVTEILLMSGVEVSDQVPL